jgi:hypothetical protein
MKQDTHWNTASMSYNPLEFYRLIKKMTLAQTEDQGTKLLLISAGDDVQPAMVRRIQHKG